MRIFLWLAAALTLVSSPQALAQRDRDQSPQLVMPNSAPRGAKTYKTGDYILRVPILWYRAALVGQEVTLRAGDRTRTLPAGTVLPEEQLLEAEDSKGFFTAYCTPRRASERRFEGTGGAMDALFAHVLRSTTDAQFCLADRDGDGQFEHSMLVGAGWGDLRTPKAIQPISYEIVADAPISSKDEVRIRFFAARGYGPQFMLEIIQQGRLRKFDFISSGGRYDSVGNRDNRIRLGPVLPQRVTIFGADFRVTGYNRAAKTVTIDWPESADARRKLQIPDGMSSVYYR